MKAIFLDDFCRRQFTLSVKGERRKTTYIPVAENEFVQKINEFYDAEGREDALIDGYAKFCKHLMVPCDYDIKDPVVEITEDNISSIRTEYVARTDTELPVLVRYFGEGTVEQSNAIYLDVILYSTEQLKLENSATAFKNDSCKWGIVSIKPQSIKVEIPPEPITIWRNAMGIEFGGSGVALDKNKYIESVAFWKNHAVVR